MFEVQGGSLNDRQFTRCRAQYKEDFHMLVLARREGESITIEGGITVTVAESAGRERPPGDRGPATDGGDAERSLLELPRMGSDPDLPDLVATCGEA